MSKTVYDNNGNVLELQEIGEVENYPYFRYEVYAQYGITDPIEGFKKVYPMINSHTSTRPNFMFLGCGSQYFVIFQKTNENYGTALIFGYEASSIIYMRLNNGTWYTS